MADIPYRYVYMKNVGSCSSFSSKAHRVIEPVAFEEQIKISSQKYTTTLIMEEDQLFACFLTCFLALEKSIK